MSPDPDNNDTPKQWAHLAPESWFLILLSKIKKDKNKKKKIELYGDIADS